MKNHKDYSIFKNPATMRVWEPPTGQKRLFTHWILSAVRLPIPPHRQIYFNFPLPNPLLEFGGI
ncbi:hypothetical protein [Syntrophomonas wolfei]|jgi:hypothetical protein|uniref:hypothetical protein n=1 Tax=Syntrophomonas wolfei TaxID=863 RepID=UPI0007744CF7|nr:hypothetical protein [Syntrophomonas wolfei]